MTLEEFMTVLKEEVQHLVDESCHVEIRYVQKNNIGQIPTLNIMEEGAVVSPNFYLNYLYEEFQQKEITIVEQAQKVVEAHYKNVAECPLEVDASLASQDPEEVRGRLFFRLVNYEKNRELLKETPHIKIQDMALMYYLFVYHVDESLGSIRASYSIFRQFGWVEEEMYQEVLANTVRLFPERVTTFSEAIEGIISAVFQNAGISAEDLAGAFWGKEFPLVITNTSGLDGAAAIVYPDLLRKLAERIGYNLFLLPASVHECLAVPDNGRFPLEKLEKMVVAVNRESVSPEEFLSDHVYYYNADLDHLLIAGADALAGKEEGNHV